MPIFSCERFSKAGCARSSRGTLSRLHFSFPRWRTPKLRSTCLLFVIKRGGDPEKALTFLRSLRGLVDMVGSEVYCDFESTARERLGDRDPEDWPILAAALAIGCPIWTEGTDFFGCGVST